MEILSIKTVSGIKKKKEKTYNTINAIQLERGKKVLDQNFNYEESLEQAKKFITQSLNYTVELSDIIS